jgi:hypothetical protein
MSDTKVPDPTPEAEAEAEAQLQRLLQRAEQGDLDVLPRLRQALDGRPDIWRYYGDLALQAEAAWLRLAAGPNVLLRETLGRKVDELKAELAGPSPSPLERLLAERVAACWLQVHYADITYPQLKDTGASLAQYAHLQRRQDAAQRRYLQAVQALLTARRLLRPALSPLDLAAKTVEERAAGGVASRRSARSPSEGVAVVN